MSTAKVSTAKSKRPARVPRPSPRLKNGLLWLLSLAALAGLLYSVYGLEVGSGLRVGEPSPETYRAPVAASLPDPLLTEAERQVARAQVEPIYTADPDLRRMVVNAVSSAGLPAEVQDLVIVRYRQPEGVTREDRAALIEEAVRASPPERQREVRLLLERTLVPSSVENVALTEAARAAASAGVQAVGRDLAAGEIIVRENEPLSAEQLAVLGSLGLYSAQADADARRLRTLLACALLGALLSLPLHYAPRQLVRLSLEQFAFLVLLSLVVLAAQRLLFLASPYFLVVALVPILVSVLVSELAGIVWTLWLAAVLALLAPTSPLFTLLLALTGGLAASLLARRFRSRSTLLVAGAGAALASSLAYLLLFLLLGGGFGLATLSTVLLLLGGGLLAGFVALGLLPLAESAFDFITEFRLVELSSPSSPLLQKLLLEAPGTYQHSLIISNLVEQAVANIGGNALLARVGALYHDVGKLKRPQFFVENQFSGVNPHDQLSPHLSYLIITSHVREGVELLREYKLPRAIEPFVTEHHGTTVLAYFYKRALEDSDRLDELNFRYPGPRPRSKESAVLMLADAVESASRTLSEPSQGSIRALIDRLIETRLQDGQLAESPLNFRDLETIANTFERMLAAILHRRITYPSSEEIQSLKRAGETRAGDSKRNPAALPS